MRNFNMLAHNGNVWLQIKPVIINVCHEYLSFVIFYLVANGGILLKAFDRSIKTTVTLSFLSIDFIYEYVSTQRRTWLKLWHICRKIEYCT